MKKNRLLSFYRVFLWITWCNRRGDTPSPLSSMSRGTNLSLYKRTLYNISGSQFTMETNECVICMDVTSHSTNCCDQPLHDACLREWIDERKSNVAKKELHCPYCRQEIKDLPEQYDGESWKKDVYFSDKLKKVWGERPFWRANGAGERLNGSLEQKLLLVS